MKQVEYVLAREQKRCTTRIQKQLTALAFGKVQALHKSLLPKVFGHAFQVLEFYGDAVLQERVSKYLITTRRFMNPCMLSQLRQSCVSNKNLCTVFEKLQLETITVPDSGPSKPEIKAKGDIIEAIIGELILSKDSSNSLHPFIDAVLEELLSFICFIGEQRFFNLMDNNMSSPDKPDAATSTNNKSQRNSQKLTVKQKQKKKKQKKQQNNISPKIINKKQQNQKKEQNPVISDSGIDTPSINEALQPMSSSSSTSTSKMTAVQKATRIALKTKNVNQNNVTKKKTSKVRFKELPRNAFNPNDSSNTRQTENTNELKYQKQDNSEQHDDSTTHPNSSHSSFSNTSTTTFIPLRVTKRIPKADCSEHNRHNCSPHHPLTADKAESNVYSPEHYSSEQYSIPRSSLEPKTPETVSFPDKKSLKTKEEKISWLQNNTGQNEIELEDDHYTKITNMRNKLITPELLLY